MSKGDEGMAGLKDYVQRVGGRKGYLKECGELPLFCFLGPPVDLEDCVEFRRWVHPHIGDAFCHTFRIDEPAQARTVLAMALAGFGMEDWEIEAAEPPIGVVEDDERDWRMECRIKGVKYGK